MRCDGQGPMQPSAWICESCQLGGTMGTYVRPQRPLRMHRDNESNRIGRYDEYGRRYLIDVTLKF